MCRERVMGAWLGVDRGRGERGGDRAEGGGVELGLVGHVAGARGRGRPARGG